MCPLGRRRGIRVGIFIHLESSGHPKLGRENSHSFSVFHKDSSSSKIEIIPSTFSWELWGVEEFFTDFLQSFPRFISQAMDPWVGLCACSSVPGFGCCAGDDKTPGKIWSWKSSSSWAQFSHLWPFFRTFLSTFACCALPARAPHPQPVRASKICATNPFLYEGFADGE